ncbi:hypothetical protein HOA55_05050 [archaeon]|jgi:hypothetical protein|nr:hypothetical protein [archaeon]MBT3578148.1 hypothetical protein [archaeon]MBT6820696.1 hypothetical protein [archaeon]MBT6955876.1 hypothetical protein [archaeon]MBT7024895.1 hypothetical protein [archaeon]
MKKDRNIFEKLPEKEALRQIEFLKNKAEYQKANIEIAVSKLLTSSSIFIAILLPILLFVYGGTEGNPIAIIISGALITMIWAIPTWRRLRLIKKTKMRIFAIGSYIKGIYKLDLGVDVDGVESSLNLLTQKFLLEMKEGKFK